MPIGCKACEEVLPELLRGYGYCNAQCEMIGKAKVSRTCNRCGKEIASGLYCGKCREERDRMASAVPASKPKPMVFVSSECQAGQSTGKERKSMGSIGGGENANGIWDNLVKAMEES